MRDEAPNLSNFDALVFRVRFEHNVVAIAIA